jgi:hypothetical protein
MLEDKIQLSILIYTQAIHDITWICKAPYILVYRSCYHAREMQAQRQIRWDEHIPAWITGMHPRRKKHTSQFFGCINSYIHYCELDKHEQKIFYSHMLEWHTDLDRKCWKSSLAMHPLPIMKMKMKTEERIQMNRKSEKMRVKTTHESV